MRGTRIWGVGVLSILSALPAWAQSGESDMARYREELARRKQVIRETGEALMPDVSGAGWRARWDVKPLPSQFDDADEYWKDAVFPGLGDFGLTETEALDRLARMEKEGIGARAAAILAWQGMAADMLPAAERALLCYSMARVTAEQEPRFTALDADDDLSIQERQTRRQAILLEALCGLDAKLTDDQVRDRYLKAARLVEKRTRLIFVKCSNWATAAKTGGDLRALTPEGVHVCEATVDILLVNPSLTATVRDLAAGEMDGARTAIDGNMRALLDTLLKIRREGWDRPAEGDITWAYRKQKAMNDLAQLETACAAVKITLQPRPIGSGAHVLMLSGVPTADVLTYPSRCYWGLPTSVAQAWLRNGSALVLVTLEGNLPEAELLKEADYWLSVMEAKTAAYGDMSGMLKRAPKAAPPAGGETVPEEPRMPPFLQAVKGQELLKKRDFAGAEDCFRQALKAETKASDWAVGLGDACLGQGRDEEALAAYRQAIQLNANDPTAHAGVGRLLAKQGKQAEAAESLFEASRLAPDNADYLMAMAEALGAIPSPPLHPSGGRAAKPGTVPRSGSGSGSSRAACACPCASPTPGRRRQGQQALKYPVL